MRVCILVFVDCIYMDIVLLHGHCTINFKCDNAFCMSIYRKTSDSSRVPYTSRAPDTGRGFK